MKKMMKTYQFLMLFILSFCLNACGDFTHFQQHADEQFGDQHFKTAIALIELHKVRFGEYPASLDDLKYTGDWDLLALNSVSYHKVDNGYHLDILKGWVGQPKLNYPQEFWQGIGLKQSNAK
ncbi:hypothetical protein HX132_00335 [Acinetobacter sp. 226-4]|nr:hypothetical protein [Acinetobacter sp. 226-1]MDM1766206.1 hypothetical protein [Acinetobacter sp. 226-4]